MANRKGVIYKHSVKPDKEKEFLRLYHQIAEYFLKHGARNFAINKDQEDNHFYIYQIWDASATSRWSETDNLPADIKNLIKGLKECYGTKKFPRTKAMEVIDKIYAE